MSKRFSILLCGAFGYGNFGDNLLRDTAVSLFRNSFPDIDIYVDRPFPNKDLIDKTDLRIIGPGGLLYEGDDIHEKYYKQYLKPPFILFGSGFQFPNSQELKQDGLCSQAIKQADLIINRHLKDLDFIKKFREDMSKVYIYPDIAFFSNIPPLYKTYIEEQDENKKENNILFSPGQYAVVSNDDKRIFKNKIKKCKVNRLLSLSTYSDSIVDYLRKGISEERTTKEYYFDSFQTVCSIINESNLFITGRFHGAVIAILLGKKVVLLPKKDGELEYKMTNLNCQKIDWDKLKNNSTQYINSIPIIENVEGYTIENIKNKKVNPMLPIITYMKEKFNIEGK